MVVVGGGGGGGGGENNNVLDNRVPVSVLIFFSHVVLRKSEK